jgi:hypothetical protein
MVNFVLVLVVSYFYYIYLSPFIFELTHSRLISLGIWGIIVGVWGNLVGMRLVKAIYVSKDYKKENYFFVILGIILVIIGGVFFSEF